MPNTINLTATLRAYSKTPFYNDYLRKPKDELGEMYDSSVEYVFKDNIWTALDTSDLQNSIKTVQTNVDTIDGKLNTIQNSVNSINCKVDWDTNKLIFTDSSDTSIYYDLPTSKVDNKTIGINKAGNLYVLDVPDDRSISVVEEYEDLYLGAGRKKVSGKLRAKALHYTYEDEQGNVFDQYLEGSYIHNKLTEFVKEISDLKAHVTGSAGYLPANNFGPVSENELDWNLKLTTYAKEQLNLPGIYPNINVPDQIKVINSYDGHTWIYISSSQTWVDDGADPVITANNNGVLGAVTGSTEKFKIFIESDEQGLSTGIMSVNGLEEEFAKVLYLDSPEFNSLVQKTDSGTFEVKDAVNNLDAVNLGQLNGKLTELTDTFDQKLEEVEPQILSDDNIDNIFNEIWDPLDLDGGEN